MGDAQDAFSTIADISDIEIKVAETLDEFRQALRVRYEVFGLEGYLKKEDHPYNIEFDIYDLLPQTTLVIAKIRTTREVIGTTRLVQDSEFGLPLEKKTDFSSARKPGRVIAEGSRIVVAKQYRRLKISDALFKIDIVYAAKHGVTHIISEGNRGYGKDKNLPPRFDVAQKIFIEKLGYVPVGPNFYDPVFQEYALPMVLSIADMPEPFRTYMKTPTQNMQKPYDALNFSN